MRVLWIVNIVMPDLASHLNISDSLSGTWIADISKMLSQKHDIKLAIACVYGKSFNRVDLNGITYYLLPGNGKNMLFYTKKYEKLWKGINEEFKPDIVHLHGTEYSHGLSFLRSCSNVKSVVSVQGIISRIKDLDFGGIPVREFVINRTLKQNIRLNGEIEMHFVHRRNAKKEAEILNRVKYINGVNTWDISLCKSINRKLKEFKLDYNLREEFYNSPKWEILGIKRHTIFTNPGGTPLKGLHQLICAGSLLIDKYPDLHIYVPGMGYNGRLTVDSAYSKYIKKLIEKLHMENHITFLGRQSADEMRNQMLSSNVVVIPSAIEGTSLILREAMYLGCPCVAAFRGGMADFISDKTDGFLYDYQEYPYLAERIDRLFTDDDICKLFSDNAIKKATQFHNRENNFKAYCDMYLKISCEKQLDFGLED